MDVWVSITYEASDLDLYFDQSKSKSNGRSKSESSEQDECFIRPCPNLPKNFGSKFKLEIAPSSLPIESNILHPWADISKPKSPLQVAEWYGFYVFGVYRASSKFLLGDSTSKAILNCLLQWESACCFSCHHLGSVWRRETIEKYFTKPIFLVIRQTWETWKVELTCFVQNIGGVEMWEKFLIPNAFQQTFMIPHLNQYVFSTKRPLTIWFSYP